MRRHIVLFIVSLMLLFAFVACGGQAAISPAAPDQPQTIEPADIDLSTLPDEVDAATVESVRERDDVVVLDVREQWEYDEGHIPGVVLIPMGEVSDRLAEIPTDKTVLVTCRSGNRSGQVTQFLRQNGYDNVHNMQGGILAWQQAGLSVEK